MREHEFSRCRNCKSLFLTSLPSAESVRALYGGESYFANPAFGDPGTGGYYGYKDYLGDRGHLSEKFHQLIARLECHVTPGPLLDVGAGPGLMVAAARSRGWDAVGVDINPWAARYGREELGVEVREQSLEAAALADESFAAVTMLDLIEHVLDPDALVCEAGRVTAPGGGLAVLTPHAGSPVSRAMGARWPEVQRAPEHVTLFSVAGLAELLSRHGYNVVGRRSIGKTSSLRILAADVGPVAPAVGRAVERAVEQLPVGEWNVHLNPRTKFVLYAVKMPAAPSGGPAHRGRTRVQDDHGAMGSAPAPKPAAQPVELSIIVPVFNELERVERAIHAICGARLPVDGRELVVVDDGSTDGTRELLREREWPPAVRILEHAGNRGKGAAIRTGLTEARGTFTTIMDADLEYDAKSIADLLPPLLNGSTDAVYGVRRFESHSAYSFWYVLGNKLVTFAASVLYRRRLSDIMTCHKIMRTELFGSLSLSEDGFGVEPEITSRLLRCGALIDEVPIPYTARTRPEGKKLTPGDGWRALLVLARCRVR